MSFILVLDPEFSRLGYQDAISRWPHRFGENGPWFIVAVSCSCSVLVVLMDLGMLGLIYFAAGSGTVVTGFLCCYITLVMMTWRTRPWFLVAMAWSRSVCGGDGWMDGCWVLCWFGSGYFGMEVIEETFYANTRRPCTT